MTSTRKIPGRRRRSTGTCTSITRASAKPRSAISHRHFGRICRYRSTSWAGRRPRRSTRSVRWIPARWRIRGSSAARALRWRTSPPTGTLASCGREFTNLYDFSNYPNVQRWLDDMMQADGHDDVHVALARTRRHQRRGAHRGEAGRGQRHRHGGAGAAGGRVRRLITGAQASGTAADAAPRRETHQRCASTPCPSASGSSAASARFVGATLVVARPRSRGTSSSTRSFAPAKLQRDP